MPLAQDILANYTKLMDNINYGLLIIDSQYNIALCNKWIKDHSPALSLQQSKKSFYTLFPELENSRISDAIENTFEFGYPAVISNIFNPTPFPLYQAQTKNKEGENTSTELDEDNRIQQQVTIARLEENNEHFCLIQITDVTASVLREKTLELEVTERKHIEDALLESEIKHLTILEKMIDGLVVFDDEGKIESFNPACEKLFGYSEADMLGKSVSILFEELATNSEENKLIVDASFIGSYREIHAIRRDKKLFDVELSISEMHITSKKFYTAIVRDITERKNIEKMKSEFISTVSHELRTPLTSIRGSLGLIQGRVLDLTSEKAMDLVDVAFSNCERLILLINDILDMEKVASGGMDYDIQKHSLTKLVSQAIKDNQAYADQYNVHYKFEEADNYFALVDQHRFLQIMANLLSNAAKFSHKNDNVDISISASEDIITIVVQDHGEGIPEKFRDSIWRKFTQADASTTRKKGGTGLGLAISRSLIEAMHGDINFESTEGEGTRFILHLPCVP